MSNSLSPKTSLNQETLERLRVALRQPFAIAVLASLAAHGLLWAALPNMFDQKKEPEPQRKVQVVELSAAERGQLPPLGLNPVPQTLLPAKPLQPTQSGTKLPDPKQYNDPLFSSTPAWEPPPPTFPLSGLPPSIFDDPTSVKRKLQTSPSPKPTALPKPSIAPKPNNAASTSTDNSSPKPIATPTAPARSDKQLIAALQAEQRQLQASYTFDGPATTPEALKVFGTNATVFTKEAVKLSGSVYDSKHYDKPEPISRSLPKEACPFVKASRTTTVGAIVKPDGQLAVAPTLLLTSGFKGLDTIAIEEVNKNKFATSDRYQIFQFQVTFDRSSICQAST